MNDLDLSERLADGKRFAFPVWYWLTGFGAALLCITSSITVTETGFFVSQPLILFAGAAIAAISLAFYTQAYVRLGGGMLMIYRLFNRAEFPVKTLRRSVLEEGGSITLTLADGKTHSIRLFHVRPKQRKELIELLGRLAEFQDNTKPSGADK